VTGNPAYDWRFGLLFAALVAATDPVAVTALFKEVKAPPAWRHSTAGESVQRRDGIVFFRRPVVRHGHRPSLGALSGQFLLVAGGGVAL
jgi:NhaP-type Na+/H+ or K+/H+ antiporter